MTPPNEPAGTSGEVVVTQAARNAAADGYSHVGGQMTRAQMRRGERDRHPLVQAFARFEARLSAHPVATTDDTMREASARRELVNAAQALVDHTYVGKPGSCPTRSKYGHFEARYYHALRAALTAVRTGGRSP